MTHPWYGERLDAESRDFAEAIDRFCLRECPPNELRKWTDQGKTTHSPELYERPAATGWLGLTIPEEYGGTGGRLRDVAILLERLSYHRLPIAGYLTTAITEQALIRYGTEEQKRAVLPRLATGSIMSIAITEP